MPLIVFGLSHHSAPVELREKLAFSETEIPARLQEIRSAGLASHAVLLSTCNRVEIYAMVDSPARASFSRLKEFIYRSRNYPATASGEFYELTEPQSLTHLFKVAAGLDSMVLGETEILGQLKKAYQLALEHGHTAGNLNRAFQRAFNAAKQIRTETNIQRGSISVGSVAVELAEKIFTTLRDREVLVLGAGDTSEKTARALLSRGARSIIVSNRSYDRAVALAGEFSGRAITFDEWPAEFPRIDIVISSTSAPHYLLDRARLAPLLKSRRHRPLLIIDIAVPRDIEPEVNLMDDVYLYNIDDLQAIAQDHLDQRKEEIARCEEIIREKVESLTRDAEKQMPLKPAPGHAFGHE
jgi:glutamyl-tRNA reductase